jgi:uncharacterized protein DUF6176
MSLYAFMAPIQPGMTDQFREFVAELGGTRKADYEASRKEAGFHRETIFLQKTAAGEMVVVVQEADDAQKAMDSLRSMKGPFNTWFFQRMKDINGVDLIGTDVPTNELLLDYRTEYTAK